MCNLYRMHRSSDEVAETLEKRIAAAMTEARQAATDAVASVRVHMEGRTSAQPGGAFVYARKPSFEFRKAMVVAGEMTESLSGRWPIGRLQDVTEDRSINAAEAACAAALEVLRKHFPEESFEMTSYLT